MLDALADVTTRRPLALALIAAAFAVAVALAGRPVGADRPAVPLTARGGDAALERERAARALEEDPDPAAIVRILGDSPITGPDGEIVVDALSSQAEADPDVAGVRLAGRSPDGLSLALAIHARAGLGQAEAERMVDRLRSDFDPGPFRLEIGGRVPELAAGESAGRSDVGDAVFFTIALCALILLALSGGSALLAALTASAAIVATLGGHLAVAPGGLGTSAALLAAAGAGGALGVELVRLYSAAGAEARDLVGAGPDSVALAGVEAGRAGLAASGGAVALAVPALVFGIDPLPGVALAVAAAALVATFLCILGMPAALFLEPGRTVRSAIRVRAPRGRLRGAFAVTAGAALLACAAGGWLASGPVLGADRSGLPTGTEPRVAAEGLARNVGPGIPSPVTVRAGAESTARVAEDAEQTAGVDGVETLEPGFLSARVDAEPGSVRARRAMLDLGRIDGALGVSGQAAEVASVRDRAAARLPVAALVGLVLLAGLLAALLRSATGSARALAAGAATSVVTAAPLAGALGVVSLTGDGLYLAGISAGGVAAAAVCGARSAAFCACWSEERQSGAGPADAAAAAGGRLLPGMLLSSSLALVVGGALAIRTGLPAVEAGAVLFASALVIDLVALRLLAVPVICSAAGGQPRTASGP